MGDAMIATVKLTSTIGFMLLVENEGDSRRRAWAQRKVMLRVQKLNQRPDGSGRRQSRRRR